MRMGDEFGYPGSGHVMKLSCGFGNQKEGHPPIIETMLADL